MKVGYSFWGFLSDYRLFNGEEISASDGCYLYVWSIINELVKRGHSVYRMMPDRDNESVSKYGLEAFSLFSKDKRYRAYNSLQEKKYPELDVLFLEWRWEIPGRNSGTDKNNSEYTPDLDIQTQLLDYYSKTDTIIIASDQDYKMNSEDYKKVDVVFDWGFKHGWHVDVPFDWEEIWQFPIKELRTYPICYVGSRYERDWAVDKYLGSIGSNVDITLFGNWLERGRESDKKWPSLKFPSNKRISNFELKEILSSTFLSPLLAKEDYCKFGLMTGRIIECLLFGCVPVGVSEFYGVRKYLPEGLVISDANHFLGLAKDNQVSKMLLIDQLRSSLSWMDVSHFVDRIETAYQYGINIKRKK